MLTTTSSEAMSEAIIGPMIRRKCPKAQRPIAAQTSDESDMLYSQRYLVTSYLRAENLLDAYYQADASYR